MDKQHTLDFSTILATSSHDMKNSLFMLLQCIENLGQDSNLTTTQQKSIADLHYQTSRINGSLMQLLALYRDDHDQLPLHIEQHSVAELLAEVVDKHQLYLDNLAIEVQIDVDETLQGYFDMDLIAYLLADIFLNALRHGHSKIILRALMVEQYLTIQVEDDGDGYPEHMLAMNPHTMGQFNAGKGRSGLGLLFAQKIASQHKNKHLKGHILLENQSQMGGSIFTLCLP